MKRLCVYLCLGAMVFSMTACGGGDNQAKESTQQTIESTPIATPEASQPATEATGESASAEEGNAGVDVTDGWSEEMEGFKTAIVEAVGEEGYIPNTVSVDPEMLEMTFGISQDMYDDYLAEMPLISGHVDTLLIIKAKDDKVEDVEAALNTYREAKVSDTMQYPSNVGKIQASRIERIGNYVCFIQLGGDTTAALDSGDEAVIEQCQHANELVIEIINANVEH